QRYRWSKMREQHGRFGILSVILAGAPPPASSIRRHSIAALQDVSRDLLGAANVIEGDGLMTSSARLVITTLTMLLKPPYPIKIFPAMGPAVEWFGALDSGISPAQFNSYLQEMRQKLRAVLSRP